MANLLGIIVTWITFPGVILHEWAHKFFCDRAGIPVYEVRYFRLGNPAGYVKHGQVTRYRDAFLITIAPFIVNTLGALIVFVPVTLNIDSTIKIAFIWLGVSFAMHAFPSDGDAKGLWAHSKRMWRGNPVALLGFPLVGVIMLANVLRIFWFDLIYAAILLGITWGVMTMVVTTGSPMFPGLAAVIVTPTPTPYPVPTYHYATAAPTLQRVQTVPGSEAPAKDWLPVAQDAMKSRNTNATLIEVKGSNNAGGAVLPINGKSHVWEYEFASHAEDKLYDVTVHDGKVESVTSKALSQSSVEKILYSYGDPTITSWNLDSVAAVATSNAQFKKLTGQDAPASAAYSLELCCWHRLAWTVCNYDATSTVMADISVDTETGEIADSWAPPT